tara:strand:- start:1498 stop:1920 length:423 start_codon:yes stop_codon:yes gene_type:complete
MKLAIVSGGFDPVHVGHIELLQKARGMADSLFVIVNNDQFLERKKGKAFMPLKERIAIMQALKGVEVAIESVDEDDTVCETLTWLRAAYKPKFEEMLFCNGGDRIEGGDTPEHEICLKIGIEPVYGLGDKIQSSSWLLKK